MPRASPSLDSDQSAPAVAAELADDLVCALRGWYFTHQRRLPWRDEPSPYRVWVSEIMLQQTQVQTVLPYFERFLAAFPDVAALAAAPEEVVLARWAGLGYYRRARHLHEAARRVMAAHGGRVPTSVEALLALPGIGRYTAGAIASIAYGQRAAVLDGNVARVLSRVFALPDAPASSAGQRRLWALAEALVPAADPSAHNQALMELGALVCTPRAPACSRCPLADRCEALALGTPEAFPRAGRKPVVKPLFAVAALVHRHAGSAEILLGKRPADGLLAGLWELPGAELASPRAHRRKALARALCERADLPAAIGDHLATVEHQFTHRHLRLEIFSATPLDPAPPAPRPAAFYQALAWVAPGAPDGDAPPLSTLTRKVLAAVERA